MTNTTEVQETKVLWDVSADQLYVWDSASKAWELFFEAADLVTNDTLDEALAAKLDLTGGTINGTLAITKTLSVTGSASIGNALAVSGDAAVGGTLTAAEIALGGTDLTGDGSTLYVGGATVWTSGNDGSGSGLDADQLDGNDSGYFTDISSRLGYTPFNAAGGTISGNTAISGTLTVTGATTLTGGISGDLTAAGSLALGGAAVDDNNVLIAEGANALFANPDGSFGFVFSKAASADDASITYQVNYATRALAGLLGDENYTIKVTPDAATWYTALVVDKDTGAIEHTQGAKFEAVTNYNNYMAADTWTKIAFNDAVHNTYGAFNASNNRFTAPVDGYYLIGTKWLFYPNSTVPASIQTKLYLNGSALDRTWATSSGTVTAKRTMVQCQTILSLSADDYVEVYAYMETNDGYVYATGSLFYGARIA